MQKLQPIGDDNQELAEYRVGKDWIEDWGSWNHMPTPFMLISEDEYLDRTFILAPTYRDYRQVKDWGDPLTNIIIHWYGSHGIAVTHTTPARYYFIGCRHEFEETQIGAHLYKLTCRKCGYSKEIDTS